MIKSIFAQATFAACWHQVQARKRGDHLMFHLFQFTGRESLAKAVNNIRFENMTPPIHKAG